jgi:hypothetical protein
MPVVQRIESNRSSCFFAQGAPWTSLVKSSTTVSGPVPCLRWPRNSVCRTSGCPTLAGASPYRPRRQATGRSCSTARRPAAAATSSSAREHLFVVGRQECCSATRCPSSGSGCRSGRHARSHKRSGSASLLQRGRKPTRGGRVSITSGFGGEEALAHGLSLLRRPAPATGVSPGAFMRSRIQSVALPTGRTACCSGIAAPTGCAFSP